ncbi:hypothetical protein DFJ77DRAFT_515826 [Powellomyces hirtus]|nr:hypothetical protein DFJ77DRAFT_515826 [Powellomyces hirtus]
MTIVQVFTPKYWSGFPDASAGWATTNAFKQFPAVAPQVPVYGTATPSSGGSGSTHVGPLEPGSTDHGDKRTPKVYVPLL